MSLAPPLIEVEGVGERGVVEEENGCTLRFRTGGGPCSRARFLFVDGIRPSPDSVSSRTSVVDPVPVLGLPRGLTSDA